MGKGKGGRLGSLLIGGSWQGGDAMEHELFGSLLVGGSFVEKVNKLLTSWIVIWKLQTLGDLGFFALRLNEECSQLVFGNVSMHPSIETALDKDLMGEAIVV
ncbi:hypothetical protein HPP92_005338 [Vanilla planifolia]|uniref:Uncharacterized protein n=1 Tax=Vanilla planifolia TaxID=51239 RepID=A0A835RPF2_VANPL|nr:hypothetical protein HPP92_005338 [Vanilla planifolia]